MASLLQDFKYGLRGLARVPGFTAVVVLTLGLGIGANSAIFSLLNGILLRPFPYGDAERLLRIYASIPSQGDDKLSVSYPDFVDLREQSKTLERVAAFRPADFNISSGEAPERIEGGVVSAGVFETFAVRPILGRVIQAEDDRPEAGRVVVMGESVWRRRFGADPNIVGQTIRLDGQPHTVIGITPKEFRFPIQGEMWTPLALDVHRTDRSDHSLAVAALPKRGVDNDAVQVEMTALANRLSQSYPDTNKKVTFGVIPFRDFYVERGRAVLYILQIAVLFVLLITCTNVANLLLARGASREREVAVRTAIGASRSRLLRQFLTESVILALLGGALGLLLANWGAVALVSSIPIDLPAWIQVGVDSRVLIFTLILSILTGLAFGLVPALRNSRTNVNETLKDTATGSGSGLRRQRLFKMIVVSEMAFTIILLVGAGLMVKSFIELQQVSPGFDPNGVLTLQLSDLPEGKYPDNAAVAAFYDQLTERVQTIEGIEAVGADSRLPLRVRGSSEAGFTVEGMPPLRAGEPYPFANYQVVTPGYFRAMQIPVNQGRVFTRDDNANAPEVVVINQAMAERYWPGQSPIGKRIKVSPQETWRSVVGVVGNVKHRGLDKEVMMDVYVPHLQLPERAMTLVVRSPLDPASLTSMVRAKVLEIDRDEPIFNILTMPQVVSSSLWLQRFGAYLLFIFGGVALVLSAAGLYGVMSYSVSQRSHEIGIRMALGAAGPEVLRLILRQSLKLVLTGMVVGMPVALLVNRFLANMLYGIGTTEIITLLGVCTVLVGVSIFASFVPAHRTTRIQPSVALRYE